MSSGNKETTGGVLTFTTPSRPNQNQNWTVFFNPVKVSVKVTFHVLSSTKLGEGALYQDAMNTFFAKRL